MPVGWQIEDEEPNGFIRYERFERMMSRVLLETQYPRDSEDKLLRAFRVRRDHCEKQPGGAGVHLQHGKQRARTLL